MARCALYYKTPSIQLPSLLYALILSVAVVSMNHRTHERKVFD